MIKIPEIELAFCNACTADCYMCSKVHGWHNEPLMSWDVFIAAFEQMQDVDFDIVQLGGDGDSFLNPIFIDSLRNLKIRFHHKKRVLYSSFALFKPEYIDVIVSEGLITHLCTRVDSLDKELYETATGLQQDAVFENIDYFIKKNRAIRFDINYASIPRYKAICKKVLNKEPYYWRPELDRAVDEFEQVKKRFDHNKIGKVNDIAMSLWAERIDPAIEKCQGNCERQYCFDSTMYIWTDGDVGICGYDDGQDALIYGNILKTPIKRLWASEEKQDVINRVRNGEVQGYPCVNPKACLFYR
jgi:hypothetical protein